jgi:predicted nucleic acid-binding protein
LKNDSVDDELIQTIVHIIHDKKPQTVNQLINIVKENVPQSENEILTAIIKLQNEGKIQFFNRSPSVPMNLSTYLKTSSALWYWLTIALSIATAFAVFLVSEDLYPWNYFRNALGVILVLWLPGYTFLKALFPSHSLENVERIALSVIMSLALISIIGLLLNYSPWGIRLAPIVLTLLVFTLVFATAAVIREYLIRNRAEKHSM